jgi:hypothetical protein
MKPNRTPETYANRVAQFLKDEKLHSDATTLRSKGKTPTHPDTVAAENPYLQARLKVLSGYKEDKRIELTAMERDGNIDNRWYAEFIVDIEIAAGDVPSLTIRNFIKGI